MKYKYFSLNGRLLASDQANVPLDLIEYAYGFGVYETLRVNKSVPLFANEHAVRLITSAQIIDLAHTYSPQDIEKYIRELIKANDLSTGNIKIMLIGGPSPEAARLSLQCLNPLYPERKLYRDGVSCITYEYEREFPNAKTLNMLSSYLAMRKARASGAYEALFLDRQGFIREGTRTNFLALKGRTVFSPPENKILLGVTRARVLEQAAKLGFTIRTRDIALEDIGKFDSLLLTSTSSKILPINQIDKVKLNTDPLALKELMSAFDHFLDAQVDQTTARL